MGGEITVKSQFGKGTTFSIQVNATSKVSRKDLNKFIKQEKIDMSLLDSFDEDGSYGKPVNRNKLIN